MGDAGDAGDAGATGEVGEVGEMGRAGKAGAVRRSLAAAVADAGEVNHPASVSVWLRTLLLDSGMGGTMGGGGGEGGPPGHFQGEVLTI